MSRVSGRPLRRDMERTYTYVMKYIDKHGYSPTMSEIKQALKLPDLELREVIDYLVHYQQLQRGRGRWFNTLYLGQLGPPWYQDWQASPPR